MKLYKIPTADYDYEVLLEGEPGVVLDFLMRGRNAKRQT